MDKAVKLLNLRENAGTLAEAQAAAAALQRELTKTGLTEADLRKSLGQNVSDFVTVPIKLTSWRRDLLFNIAKANGGTLISHPWARSQSLVIDQKRCTDVMSMFRRLHAEILHLTKIEQKRLGWRERGYTISFQRGAVAAIRVALLEAARHASIEYTGGYAIVLNESAARQAYIEKEFGKLVTHKRRGGKNWSGYLAGVDAGNSIRLDGAGSLE